MRHAPGVDTEIFKSVDEADGKFRAGQFAGIDEFFQSSGDLKGTGNARNVVGAVGFVTVGGDEKAAVGVSFYESCHSRNFALISAALEKKTYLLRPVGAVFLKHFPCQTGRQGKSAAAFVTVIDLSGTEKIVEPPSGVPERGVDGFRINGSKENFTLSGDQR